MAQQINLYSPAFMKAPKQPFSARTMGACLLALVVLLGAAGTWMHSGAAALRHELKGTLQALSSQRDQLTQALAVPAVASGAALEQEAARLQRDLAQRRAWLHELEKGRLVEGQGRAAMLRVIAQTVPAAVWLHEIRVDDRSLDVEGMTLDPAALRVWLMRLADHPLTHERRLGAVKLERVAGSTAPGTSADAAAPVWSFSLASHVLTVPPGEAPSARAAIVEAMR
jgi:Tfp pilus assembly protein PilN